MVEGTSRNLVSVIEGVTVTPVSIEAVPSDINPFYTMDISQAPNDDVFIRFNDLKSHTIIKAVRINGNFEGGPYTLVTDELVNLIRNFASSKEPDHIRHPEEKKEELFSSIVNPLVLTGGPDDDFRIKVSGIESMDNPVEEEDLDLFGGSFLDIIVGKNGNVTTAIRNTGWQSPKQLILEFKTAENGGKFPLVAQTFTRICERFIQAA